MHAAAGHFQVAHGLSRIELNPIKSAGSITTLRLFYVDSSGTMSQFVLIGKMSRDIITTKTRGGFIMLESFNGKPLDLYFAESVSNYQKLVDVLIEHTGKDGNAEISQEELARLTDHSQTWVGQAIKKLNTEDICIERLGLTKYKVHYQDIMKNGVFSKMLVLLDEYIEKPMLLWGNDKFIADRHKIKLKTVRMFKSYVRFYWKKRNKQS